MSLEIARECGEAVADAAASELSADGLLEWTPDASDEEHLVAALGRPATHDELAVFVEAAKDAASRAFHRMYERD